MSNNQNSIFFGLNIIKIQLIYEKWCIFLKNPIVIIKSNNDNLEKCNVFYSVIILRFIR